MVLSDMVLSNYKLYKTRRELHFPLIISLETLVILIYILNCRLPYEHFNFTFYKQRERESTCAKVQSQNFFQPQ